jgi:hypothetical protein
MNTLPSVDGTQNQTYANLQNPNLQYMNTLPSVDGTQNQTYANLQNPNLQYMNTLPSTDGTRNQTQTTYPTNQNPSYPIDGSPYYSGY